MSHKFGELSPTKGRYQTLHVKSFPESNLKSGTGVLARMLVAHDFIELIEFGWEVSGTPGTLTTGGAVRLDKIPAGNGSQINGVTTVLTDANGATPTAASSTLTFTTLPGLNSNYNVDLNVNAATSTPLAGPPVRPTAVKGDVIVFTQTIQGVDTGAQTVELYLMFRERTQ